VKVILTSDGNNIVQHVLVFWLSEPIVEYVKIFDLEIERREQFSVLLLFKVASLQFLVDRTRYLLKFEF
jgi:hypothetical protein